MAVLPGTTGNDTYAGTSGASDTAVIGANSTSATFAFDGTRWIVTSGAGTDTLSSVESVQFADRTFNLVPGFGASQSLGSGYESFSSVARLAGGGWVVTWQGDDGSSSGITMQRFNAAGELVGTETRVNAIIDYAQSQPSVTGLTGGGYVVAWQTQGYNASFTEFQIKAVYQRYDAAGNKLGGEVPIATNTTGMIDLEVAGTANGGFAATWSESSGTGTTLLTRLYDSNGAAVAASVPLASIASGTATNVELVALGSGYVAVWEQAEGAGTAIFQQRVSSTGTKIGSAVKVSGSEATNQQPVVASLEDGSYVVAWTASGASGAGLHVQRFASNGTKIGAAFPAHGDSQVHTYQSLAATGLEDGGFVVVWRGAQNGAQGMYLQRFDSSGSPLGTVQGVKQYAYYYSDATDPDVVSLANGGFVVTWTESGAVHTQRFNVDGVAFMSEISGTTANDVITFTGGTNAKLEGKGGNDSLTGGSGNDVLDGGAGADTMTGGGGNDTYVWQAGDVIVETAYGGVDTVQTTVSYTLASRYLENAVLTGTAKGDLVGNGNANRLTGNAADNVLNGGGGADTLTGGAGNDTFVIDHGGDQAIEAAGGGSDTVISSVTTVLAANLEHLRLGGGVAIDGTGNGAANLITGNAYANRLEGLAGADTLVGGLGDDTYVLQASALDEYREYGGEGRDTIAIDRSWILNSGKDSIENLTLREGGAFSATGDGIANVILGNSRANLIDGKGGADTMDGGGGDDTYMVGNAGDIAAETGYGGIDLVKSSVTHTLGSNIENLTLLTTANLKGTGNELWNVITGNAGANSLNGLAGADTLVGGAGNDTMTSADGMDLMLGGSGNDIYVVASENDEIVEISGEGTDAVIASVERSYTLNENVEKLTLVGLHVDGHGNTLANTIVGTAGNNVLDGGTGADVLTGMAGHDVYIVDNVRDVVNEAASGGTDEVFAMVSHILGANLERMTLGGSAAINGTGNVLGNRLIGNNAANVLDGKAGSDTLTGGKGTDTFSFSSALGASNNVDRITDFSVADDTIRLENGIFKAFVNAGAIASGNLRAGTNVTRAADANDFLLYNSTTGALYYDADGSGSASSAVQFATIGANLALTAADFLIL